MFIDNRLENIERAISDKFLATHSNSKNGFKLTDLQAVGPLLSTSAAPATARSITTE